MSNKLRNRLLAFICILVFVGLGLLLYVNWFVQKPFAVILFLSDGMTPGVLTATRLYEGGASHRLRMESPTPHLAMMSNSANDFAVPDAGAAAGMLSTGTKLNNRTLSVDGGGTPLPVLADVASDLGRAVGIVSNGTPSAPGIAAFFAKSPNPADSDSIVAQLVDRGNVDVLLAGGAQDFLPEIKDGHRKDGRDLLLEMRQKGYDIARNRSELESTPSWRAPKILGLFAQGNLAYADTIQSAGPQPSLADLTRAAIQFLQFNRKGYLLVVDAGLVTAAAESSRGERVLREMIEFDKAIEAAREYAGEKALIIVAGRVNTGGFHLNGYPLRNDKGVALTGINPQGVPAITWSTGPGGGDKNPAGPAPQGTRPEPAAYTSPAAIGVAGDIVVLATGPGSEKVGGFLDNTDIAKLIRDNL